MMKMALGLGLITLSSALVFAAAEDLSSSQISKIKITDYLKNISSSQILEKIDTQGAGRPDIFVIYDKKDNDTKTLVMQLFDLNRDGKVDLVKHFEKGKLVRTESDLDFDGKVDLVSEYDPHSGELKRKIQADGATNIWKHYFKSELRKKEVDRNGDGKPDMWVYYRGGKILRTEIDKDFNGKISRVDNNSPLVPKTN